MAAAGGGSEWSWHSQGLCLLFGFKPNSTQQAMPPVTQGRSFEHADSAISNTSLSLRGEPIRLGLTCRTHRLLENTLHSGGWRGPNVGSSNSLLIDGQFFLQQTTKKHKEFTAVIHEDADHTRTLCCCHGAVCRA